MRKQVLACLLLGALGAQAQEKFVVEGQLKNIPDGTVFYLMKQEGNVGSMAATDTLQNGTFRFELTTAGNELEGYGLMARDDTKFPPMLLELWVNPGSHLLIQGENPYIYSWKVESDVKEQQFQQQLIQASHKEWEEFQRLTMQEFALMRSAAQGGNKEQVRAQADSLQQLTEKLSDQIAQHNIAIMKQSPINAAWMGELHRMGMSVKFRKDYPYKKEVQQLYNLLDDAQKETSIGKSVYLALNPPTVVKVGEEAADADMYDLEGKVHRLAEFRGKYILLDFWSRGCGPCIMSQPELKEISEMYKDSLEDEYVIGSPLFKKATITMENGNKFVIEAPENSKENLYIQSATLNGRLLDKNYIHYDDIAEGGVLKFEMGSQPNKERCTSKYAAPFSLSKE